MNNYEIKIYLKKHDTTRIITAAAIVLTREKVQIADYATGEILFYNRDDIKIEYMKEAE